MPCLGKIWLPLTQLINAPLFRGIDICGRVLAVLRAMLEGLRFRPEQNPA